MAHLRLDTAAGTAARLREDVWLDAGAFGKGLALWRARDRLREAGVESALLDFGGQLVGWGPGPDGEGHWSVGVAHPLDRHESVASVRLRDTSASTTSGSERFVRLDGEDLSHVLDPRTGRPAPAWGSVTVVHPDPMVADILSTALFVMGPGEGEAWARRHEVAVLFLRIDGGEVRRTATPAMTGVVEPRRPAEDP
jgi:thiamine biosynthesis lipoprotein